MNMNQDKSKIIKKVNVINLQVDESDVLPADAVENVTEPAVNIIEQPPRVEYNMELAANEAVGALAQQNVDRGIEDKLKAIRRDDAQAINKVELRSILRPADHKLQHTHIGDHSVDAIGIFTPRLYGMPEDVECNALDFLCSIIENNSHLYAFDGTRIALSSHLTNDSVDENYRIDHKVVEHVNRATVINNMPLEANLPRLKFQGSRVIRKYRATVLKQLACIDDCVSSEDLYDIVLNQFPMNRVALDSMITIINCDQQCFDNTALYTHLFLLWSFYYDVEQLGGEVIVDGKREEVLEQICLTPPEDLVPQMVYHFDQYINEHRFFISGAGINAPEMTILRLLNYGITALQHNRPGMVFFQQLWRVEPINFVLYHYRVDKKGQPIDIRLPNVSINAARILNFTLDLAARRNENIACYSGFIQALMMIHGRMIGRNTAPNADPSEPNRFMMCTYEIGNIILPFPRSGNPWYDIMGWSIPQENVNYVDAELQVFRTGQANIRMAMATLAVLISTSISIVMHGANITGRELNNMISNRGNIKSRMWLEDFSRPSTCGRNQMFKSMLSVLYDFGNICINPLVIGARDWQNQFIYAGFHVADRGEKCLWQGVFGLHIPYMFDPLCLAHQYKQYPNLWGLSYPGATYNGTYECIKNLPADCRGWFANSGSIDYTKVCDSGNGYKYVPYGVFFINAYKQHNHDATHYNIKTEVIQRSSHSSLFPLSNRFDVQWDDNLYMIKPGTLITYDWERSQVLVPCIMYVDHPGFFKSVSSLVANNKEFSGAGLASIQVCNIISDALPNLEDLHIHPCRRDPTGNRVVVGDDRQPSSVAPGTKE